MKRRTLWCAVIAAMVLCGWPAEHASAQCQYSVTVVEGPPCGIFGVSVHFFGLNDYGQACGEMAVCGTVSDKVPIVWTEELGLIELPLPEGATGGVANDINNVLGSDGFGQVACTLSFTGEGNRACLYDDGLWTVLDSENSEGLTEAFAINDNGWIAGYRDTRQGRMALRWRDKVVDEISSPIGDSAIARDINADSATAGGFGALTTDGLGFLWEGGAVTLIPPVQGGNSSEARGINSSDVVTGQSRIPVKSGSPPRRSWKYQSGMLIDLGGFTDTHRLIAEDINDAVQIVGSSFAAAGGSGETSFLWQDGELIKLDDLIEDAPGFFALAAVKAINNRGQIAGYSGGTAEGIILTPIEVPLGDVDFDCEVDGWDLALLLGDWGPCAEGSSCLTDMVSSETFQPPPDGVVDGADLAVVLGNWTPASQGSPRRNQ